MNGRRSGEGDHAEDSSLVEGRPIFNVTPEMTVFEVARYVGEKRETIMWMNAYIHDLPPDRSR